MYTQVAYALAVTSGTDAVSQAVSVAGANAVGVDVTVINAGSTETVTVGLQGSNDLANWKDVDASLFVATGIGYDSGQFPDSATDPNQRIGFQYVRLVFTQSANTGIISAGINVFEA